MENFFEPDIAFYRLIYKNSVYRIRPKNKYYVPQTSSGLGMVAENREHYLSPVLPFQGITSKTLLLFNYPDQSGIPATEKAFLDQVLGAVKLTFDKLAWADTSDFQEGAKWENISAQSSADVVIGFGVDKDLMPQGIGEGEIYNCDGKRVLCAASLAETMDNGGKKKTLWQALKEIYGI